MRVSVVQVVAGLALLGVAAYVLLVNHLLRDVESYSGAVVSSANLSCQVFLPIEGQSKPAYYRSTRFDHGSMIGPCTFKGHELYGAGLWRQPHDPSWTESGVGLASEFGCGDDGSACGASPASYGWAQPAQDPAPEEEQGSKALGSVVSNGVLGFDTALPGGAFLKIGVGALLKGSCPACADSSGDSSGQATYEPYHFNSPYKFASSASDDANMPTTSDSVSPEWVVVSSRADAVVMEQTATLDQSAISGGGSGSSSSSSSSSSSGESGSKKLPLLGYKLRKTVRVDGATLFVESELTNLGDEPFATPFYSHHFFNVDDQPIGPGYSLALLGLEAMNASYLEPGVGTGGVQGWAQPFASVAELEAGGARVRMSELVLGGDTKLKAEYRLHGGPGAGRGVGNAFELAHSIGVKVREEVVAGGAGGGGGTFSSSASSVGGGGDSAAPELFAYNLYAERGTLSPEPMFLLGPLAHGEKIAWTQRLDFSQPDDDDDGDADAREGATGARAGSGAASKSLLQPLRLPLLLLLGGLVLALGAALGVPGCGAAAGLTVKGEAAKAPLSFFWSRHSYATISDEP